MTAKIKVGKFELIGITNISIFIFSIFFWLATCLFHLKVTNVLIHWVNTPWGRFIPRNYTIHSGIIFSTLLFIYILYQCVKGTRRLTTLLYWIFLTGTILLSFRYLITAPIEIIHFPQYAIPSILLARAFDKDKKNFMIGAILFWVTIMGMIDEINQYFHLTKNYTEYLDWNDFILNEIGAAVGLLIYYGFQNNVNRKWAIKNVVNSSGFKFTIIFSCFVFILFILDILKISTQIELSSAVFMDKNSMLKIYLERLPGKYGSWQERDLGGFFITLNCFYGPLIMTIFGFIFNSFSYTLLSRNKEKKSDQSSLKKG